MYSNTKKPDLVHFLFGICFGFAVVTVFVLGSLVSNLVMKDPSSISIQNQFVNQSVGRWECPKKLVVLEDVGRMGNKFFEHLGCRLMAKDGKWNTSSRKESLIFFDQYFVGWLTPSLTFEELEEYCEIKSSNFVTKYLSFDGPTSIHQPFLKCRGYPDKMPLKLWQKIFRQRLWLLKEFQWRLDLKENLDKRLDQLTVNRTYSVSVGVHVLMGDYQKHLNIEYAESYLAGANYFNKAMNYFRNKYTNPIFFIVSNDLKWSMENIMGDDIIYPGSGTESDPGWDLAILANSDHLILTYGTFGLMAAFLKGVGEVIAADNFTTKAHPQTEIIKALNPPNWIFMSIE